MHAIAAIGERDPAVGERELGTGMPSKLVLLLLLLCSPSDSHAAKLGRAPKRKGAGTSNSLWSRAAEMLNLYTPPIGLFHMDDAGARDALIDTL